MTGVNTNSKPTLYWTGVSSVFWQATTLEVPEDFRLILIHLGYVRDTILSRQGGNRFLRFYYTSNYNSNRRNARYFDVYLGDFVVIYRGFPLVFSAEEVAASFDIVD
jgi:hypothetical protein